MSERMATDATPRKMAPVRRRTAPTAPWRSRIAGSGEEAPDQLLANPSNWRIHPKAQQDALVGALDQVGWVGQVPEFEDRLAALEAAVGSQQHKDEDAAFPAEATP